MYNYDGSPTVSDCIFIKNSGRGMFNGGECSSPTVTNCVFRGNGDGGMYNVRSNPTVIDCVFSDNSANFGGGGMFNYLSSPTISGTTFVDNSARSGGGMRNALRSNPLVANCMFARNSADRDGGGLYNDYDTSPTLTNCTFTNNSAGDRGGGMYNTDSNPLVTNCIIWGNRPDEIRDEQGANPTVRYSNVRGGYDGEGNIDADPMFVNPDGGDFHIAGGSPCIDAADNTATANDEFDLDGNGDRKERVPFDLDGSSRFLDDPDTEDTGRCEDPCELPIVDMGAYEFGRGACCIEVIGDCTDDVPVVECLVVGGRFEPGVACEDLDPPCSDCVREPVWLCDGDVDGDGQVNPVDSGLVQAAFGSVDEQDLCNYDIDCDNQINPVDAGIVQSLFGTCALPRVACR